MNKIQEYIVKKGHLIMAMVTGFAVWLINSNVHLYGDDFFYYQFTNGDFSYFIQRHIEHYQLANGRAIVHVLATYFLSLNPLIWQIVSSLLLGLLVYLGTQIVEKDQKHRLFQGIILFSFIGFLHIHITRQSIYWMTGSFNYVYPLCMFFIYWKLLASKSYEKSSKILLFIMAFLAAATVEQVSLMTLGLSFLYIIDRKFIKKEKLHSGLLISFFLALIGTVSVVLAPSVFLRASIENAPVEGLLPLIIYNLGFQGKMLFFSEEMMPYMFISIMSSLGIVYKYRKASNPRFKFIHIGATLVSVLGGMIWLWQMTSKTPKVSFDFNHLPTALFLLIAFGSLLCLFFYAGLLTLIHSQEDKRSLPMMALILGFGSQMMMIISPVYGQRNLVTIIFMLAIFSTYMLVEGESPKIVMILAGGLALFYGNLLLVVFFGLIIIMEIMYKENLHINVQAISYITIALIAGSVLFSTYSGYKVNNEVYDNNEIAASDFLEKEDFSQSLIQEMLPLELYGWAMPYHNHYYDAYYNLYLTNRTDINITWID